MNRLTLYMYIYSYLTEHESGGEGDVESRRSADLLAGVGVQEHALIKVPVGKHAHLILSVQSSPEVGVGGGWGGGGGRE